MSSADNEHVLVIAGTIILGYAGAKCAQFALETMGMEVTAISPDYIAVNVNYKDNAFLKLKVEDIDLLYSKFKANGLHTTFSHIITGYVADKEYIAKTIEIVKDIKKHSPNIVYVCDPVLGDNGEDYFTVREETECVFRDVLVPMCDVTTPNQFEAECLSGIKIHTQNDAIKAMRTIHDIGPSIVVITSVKIDTENNDVIVAMASSYKDSVQEVYRIEFPRIDEYLIGTGDLFAGCFTGLLHKSDSMKTAFEKAISICQVVCQRTIVDARKRAGPGNKPTQHQLDLRLPKCAKFLMDPTVEYPAIKIM